MSTKLATILADFTTSLSTKLDVGGTSATLVSATDDDGVALPAGVYFFTLDGNNSQKEHIVCTLSGTSITGIYSVSRQGVETSGVARVHRIGCTVSITDFGHIKFINDLISGNTLLDYAHPLGYDGAPTLSSANQLATKGYADALALAGAGPASVTGAGLVRLSAAPSVTIGTVTMTIASPGVMTAVAHGLTVNDAVVFTTSGSLPTGILAGTTYYVIATGLTADAFQVSATAGGSAVNTSGSQSGTHTLTKTTPIAIADSDYRLNKNNYAVDAQVSDTYVITLSSAPTTYAAGQLFQFKAATVNTGACTLNVNSLGAKSLKMNGNLTPVDGYIKAGAVVSVLYDGTNFQILSVSGKPSVSQTGEETYASSGAGVDDYAITLTPAPVAYVTGMVVRFLADVSNTGASTLNVNALGAKTIKKNATQDLANYDILAGQMVLAVYDGTYFQLLGCIANNLPFVTQDIGLATGTGTTGSMFMCSDITGNTLFIATDGGGTTCTIYRLVKDLQTGNYYITHSTTLTVSSGSTRSMAVCGSFLYISAVIGGTSSLRRYAVADLSGVTSMTGVTAGDSRAGMWSDGTFLYIPVSGGGSFEKYSISGSTVTDTGAVAFTSSGTQVTSVSDGTNVWVTDGTGAGTVNIRKYAVAGGAVISTTTHIIHADAFNGVGALNFFLGGPKILGIGWGFNQSSASAVVGLLAHVYGVSLPI